MFLFITIDSIIYMTKNKNKNVTKKQNIIETRDHNLSLINYFNLVL